MEGIFSWLKNIICCLCILELLYHMVPNPGYQKYLRFFGSLIFLLVALNPLLDVFSLGKTFDKSLEKVLFQEETMRLQEAEESLGQLQNEKIQEAFRIELERQMAAVVRAHGRRPEETKVTLEQEDGVSRIARVEIRLSKSLISQEGEEEDLGGIREEISAVYGVEAEQVKIWVKG